MKKLICCAAAVGGAALSHGQTPAPSGDHVLVNLTTPSLLDVGKAWADVSIRGFGGADKLAYTDVWAAFGFAPGWEADVRAGVARDASITPPAVQPDLFRLPSGETVRFGGYDNEFLIRYRVQSEIPISLQGGFAYTETPAQNNRLEGVVGASVSYSVVPQVDVFAEPKAVFLDNNSLFGIGLGASIKLADGIHLVGDWTPVVSGDNSVNTNTGLRDRVQLFGVGLRFSNLAPGWAVDLGITNATGYTTGTSLTPSIGNTAGFYIGGEYRF